MSTKNQMRRFVYLDGVRPGRPRELKWRFPQIDEAIQRIGSIERFFEKSGICRSTYYNLQHGISEPNRRTIDAICKYTGLTYEEAFGQ